MRNNTSAQLGQIMTNMYKSSSLSIDEFISSIKEAYDVTLLHDGYNDKYACMHIVVDGNVVTYYYWQSKDEWFATF